MEEHNSMLRTARMRKSWTPEFVSKRIGVSLDTYKRWEKGAQKPRLASVIALCHMFSMSPTELGLQQHYRLAGKLEEQIVLADDEELYERGLTEDEHDPELILDREQLSNFLELWTTGMHASWDLYMEGMVDVVEPQVLHYLECLLPIALQPGPGQKDTASLVSQVYQMIALLHLQSGDFVAAQSNGMQALVYSQLAKDWNMYVAAQIRLAGIYAARKRIGSALNAYNDALQRVNALNNNISPILHSWIFAGLAEIQATMGRERESLQFLNLAIAVFPDDPEDDMCNSYAQCDCSMLHLYQGLVFLRLGQPKHAWDAFARVDEMQPSPPARVRAEFLKHRAYTSIMLGNLTQSCIYLEAAAKAAKKIQSELNLSEVYTLYENMLTLWGREERVRKLATLFQK